jgi:biotin carboxylase
LFWIFVLKVKKLMVLAAGLLQIPVIKKAHDMGVYVIAVDDDPNAPGMALADKAIVPGGLIIEEKLLAIAKEEKIDGVIHPCSEVAMNVMGRINDELHLSGISRETAVRATNKHLMREAFEAYGAPSPKSYCTNYINEGWSLFKSIGGKAILKPSRNSGSRGIAEIEYDIQFGQFAKLFERSKEESRDDSVMIEQFVEGPEFSVEIIVWNNTVNVLQVTDKKTTEAPYFVELGHSQPSQFPKDVVNAIKKAAVQGVKALQLNNCAAHAEVKYQDGKPYIMEIGARLGGDFISTELTHLSTGIDMVAAAIDVALGNEPTLKPTEEGYGVCIRYFTPEPGEVEYVNEGELKKRNNVYNAEIYVKPGDMVDEVKSSLDRSGHVIVTADNVKTAVEEADKIVGGVYYLKTKKAVIS